MIFVVVVFFGGGGGAIMQLHQYIARSKTKVKERGWD